MAVCKECVHVAVCSYAQNANNAFENCANFQDRSRFVELPCVGDKIYELCHQFGDYKIGESEIKGFIVDTDGTALDYELLGKRFFLTREEAEQVLKEHEKNA